MFINRHLILFGCLSSLWRAMCVRDIPAVVVKRWPALSAIGRLGKRFEQRSCSKRFLFLISHKTRTAPSLALRAGIWLDRYPLFFQSLRLRRFPCDEWLAFAGEKRPAGDGSQHSLPQNSQYSAWHQWQRGNSFSCLRNNRLSLSAQGNKLPMPEKRSLLD